MFHSCGEEDVDAFRAFHPDGVIWTAVVQDGDALALPPGYMFTDLVSHNGACGITFVYVHRGLSVKLQSFFDQRSLYCKDEKDEVLEAVLKDIVFI